MRLLFTGLVALTIFTFVGCGDKSTNLATVDRSNIDFQKGPMGNQINVQMNSGPAVVKPEITLRGKIDQTPDNCYILIQDKGPMVDLRFPVKFEIPKFVIGTRYDVTGIIDAQLGSPCVEGAVMQVKEIRPISIETRSFETTAPSK
jgi:hypothetical protein